ncbi:MAG TPA: phosphatase PAP2 family protein [Stellaceae bacterium]|nr:phosphatase PAP2 family protein [Stellaceae bacterium]
MASLHTLDQRLLDQSLTATGSAGGMLPGASIRPRFNTQILTRFVDASDPRTLARAQVLTRDQVRELYKYWDADLQSYTYLQAFLQTHPRWMNDFAEVATRHGVPSQDMDPDRLGDEICGILELAPEREERFAEVIDQDDADGAANYWLGMLQISPARQPATYLLIRVGRRIGEHVVMCLKDYFRSPRPSQLSPAVVPMIDPPGTPSFPAGHAVQSYLISYLLAYSLPNIPQHHLGDVERATGPLFKLADRISQNRVVAGVHFPTDIIAGKAVGIACFEALQRVGALWDAKDGLRGRVREELPQYA